MRIRRAAFSRDGVSWLGTLARAGGDWSVPASAPAGHERLLTVKLRAYSQSLLHFQPYRLTRLSESETSKLVSSLETAPSNGSRIGRGKYNRIPVVVLSS